ncbi:hypothetical protein [Aureibacter tunicatorum]|uniref:Uncharacterized protein n=1 Tax=Aureibacter tunicatorum TaxID=866807 RepID=A0AAE3XJ75_9BACT|nr:hypothetical protein [Aureibacter tunicatorum]MDR6237134.1 hypothetical protein [Aureibacter tunicatorum]BDD06126.1 hypothetical protein AUTU_36090 [Aureibacter tunicatorum]
MLELDFDFNSKKMVKQFVVICLLLFAQFAKTDGDCGKSEFQTFDSEKKYFDSFLETYVCKSIDERTKYLLNYFKEPQFWYLKVQYDTIKIEDKLIEISSILIADHQSVRRTQVPDSLFHYGCHGGFVLLTNQSLFSDYLAHLQYNEINYSTDLDLVQVESKRVRRLGEHSYLHYLEIYFKNSIRNRMEFIDYYRSKLDEFYLSLMQRDIDTILKVNTPNLIVNGHFSKDRFEEASLIWMEKIKKNKN